MDPKRLGVLVLLAVAGCDQSTTVGNPKDGGAGTDGGPPAGAAAFVGTWTPTGNGSMDPGTLGLAGSGSLVANQDSWIFVRGTDTDLVSMDSYGCRLTWTVNGSQASLSPGQTCTVSQSVAPLALTIATGALVLTVEDAFNLTFNLNLTGNCTYDGGNNACSALGVGLFTRTGP
jgi:hypothetical protein